MSVSSDELNYLVYRYLQESGFQHSAFTFAYESLVAKSNVAAADVPPGALVSFVQKGLQYCDIEAHLNEDGSERHCQESFSLLTPHVCQLHPAKRANTSKDSSSSEGEGGGDGGGEPAGPGEGAREVPEAAVRALRGHTAEVYAVAWHPTAADVLATGSGDATGRLWRCAAAGEGGAAEAAPTVLKHYANNSERAKDIVAVAWSPDGAHLATACYDGVARVWGRGGELVATLQRHRGALYAVQWNPAGTVLLTAAYDRSVVCWDAAGSGEAQQQLELHQAAVLDAAWRDDETFATCSADRTVMIARTGESRPLRVFQGHQHDVNSVRWSRGGAALASGSDDATVKLWSPDADEASATLQGHELSVAQVRWSPVADAALASASHDGCVKLWDAGVAGSGAASAAAVRTLAGDTPVYSLAYSPDGSLIATGALRGAVRVWDVRAGAVAHTYAAAGDVFQVDWAADGRRLAAAVSNCTGVVLDLRMPSSSS